MSGGTLSSLTTGAKCRLMVHQSLGFERTLSLTPDLSLLKTQNNKTETKEGWNIYGET